MDTTITAVLLSIALFRMGESQNAPPVAHFYQLYGKDDHIPENTPPGTAVFYINATDPDSPQRSLSLRLNSNTFKFRSGQDNHVILIKSLNFEASTTASFALAVSDGESETIYSHDVTIDDVNDVSPKFSQLRYQRHLAELTPVGALVFADVTVKDEDVSNSILEVACTYNAAFPDSCNIFYVNTTEATNVLWRGNIYLNRPLDYETMQEAYQLHLTAKDGNADNDYLMNFEIIIDDVTDAPPYFTATFDARINEDVLLGTHVLTVEAKDGDLKDRRDIKYDIIDNPGGWFDINPVTGNITTARLLDRNSPNLGAQGIVTLNVTAQEVLADGQLGRDPSTQSFVDVKITIIDVNNNPPSFTQTHYSVNMSESLQNGQAVPGLTMHVSDADGADNAYFKFVFSGLRDYEDIFRVSPPEAQGSTTATLVVRNSSALDYDKGRRQYTLEVIAREVRTDSNLSSTAVVTIYLQDANDNKPAFQVDHFNIPDLSELTQPEALIARLPLATDIDTGLFGTSGIVYTLIGYGNNRFALDPVTGYLRLGQCSSPGSGSCLDHESAQRYDLMLIATDNNGAGHESRIPLTITILDENDNIPEFTSDAYQYRVQEMTTLLRTDQPISATDRDSSRNGNNRIRYSLVTDRLSLFSIDLVTGVLSLNRPIQFRDGDENGRLTITVGAGNLLDGASRVDFSRNTSVEILVDDINNNAPRFPKNYTARILENIRPDTHIVTVTAEDDDFGQNAAIEYSIVSGAEDTFEVDINTGVISRRGGAILDFDITFRYIIRVKASDKGNPRLYGFTFVVIDIIDNNNKDPLFYPPTTYANVSEDADLDFAVVAMQAIDRDVNADLRYSFIQPIIAYNMRGQLVSVQTHNYTDLFRIDSGTGQVFVNMKLDITKVKTIIYTVRAVDIAAEGPAQIGTGTLNIEIINANNHAPVFERLDRENSVLEEQPLGSLVMILTASDGDRDVVTYEIVEQSLPNAVTVHPITGRVTVADRIDYESVQVITFTARASDGANKAPFRSVVQQFSVTVLNINDNKPVFSEPYYKGEISENTTYRQIVTIVLATDLDLPPYGDIKYRLPTSITQFRVDENSGVIYKEPGVVYDKERMKGDVEIPVIAYDGPGVPSRSAVVPVYISIKDINDNSPYFHESDVYVTLSSHHPVGSSVTRLFAFDDDVDDILTYSIKDDPAGRYKISSSGVISTTAPLTTAPDHVFDVMVKDRAGNSATVHVHITIIGNRSGPRWNFPSFNGDKIIVCEDHKKERVINPTQLLSADGAVSYSFLINGEETDDLEGTFRLIPTTGEIMTKSQLDRESKSTYLVQLIARDRHGRTSQRYLMIEICDKDDNHPEFPEHSNGTVRSYTFYIESGLVDCVKDPRRNYACGYVRATDPDLPVNAKIVYTIIKGGDSTDFIIDPITGVISTTRELNYAIRSLYILNVAANNYRDVNGRRDLINNPRHKVATVYIYVLPTSEQPVLIRDGINIYTSIDTQIGECLDSMRPAGMKVDVTYTIRSEKMYDGRTLLNRKGSRHNYHVGPQNGTLCTLLMFNPSYSGYHYRIVVDVKAISGRSGSGTAYIWLTSNVHKIRIVINGDTGYVYSHKAEILEALRKILNTKIVWIDSVGHYTTKDGYVDIKKSNVIIYAVNEKSLHLYRRNETIIYINEQIAGKHRSIALSARIIGAEDITTKYIYLTSPTPLPITSGGGGAAFPVGLLIAMLLLLPLLLLPFLLCCLLCCPCCASLFGGAKKEKYAVLGAAGGGGYQEGSFIDDWYEQSRLYNNPAYVDEDWDSGSAHLLVNLDKGKAANGAAHGAAAGSGQQVTEETEEYYRQNVSGNRGLGNGSAAAMVADGAAAWDGTDGEARTTREHTNMVSAGDIRAESAVIVDTLIPAATSGEAKTVLLEEERTERQVKEESNRQDEKMQPLVTTIDTDHQQMSSLSPATIDILDSASTYNAQVATRSRGHEHRGKFSHTATVPRYGARHPPESDDYITSESYESDHHTNRRQRRPSRGRYQEESGVTIVLDAQPSGGMEAENVEYEVVTGRAPQHSMSQHSRSGYTAGHSSTLKGSRSGTIPRNGFTIELEPTTGIASGMVADREEYVLTDEEGLAPQFYADASAAPKQHKRYKKTTTTRTMRGSSGAEAEDGYFT